MIRIQELQLTAMGGIAHGQGFALRELSPGINLIHGPNGCGKTTAARAMRDLIWHHAPPTHPVAWLQLILRDDQDHLWTLQRNGTQIQATRDGNPTDPPEWSPADTRARHTWTLQDLMETNTGDLARRVEILMQNNVDLAAHARALGWDTLPPAPRKLVQDLKQAEDKAREIRQAQEVLLQSAAELQTRRQTLARLRATADTAGPIQDARTFRETGAALAEIKERLRQAPPAMQALREDDATLLQSKCGRRDELERKLEQTRNALTQLPEPDPACAAYDLDTLHAWQKQCPRLLQTLRDRRRDAEDADSVHAKTAAKIDALCQRHGLLEAEAFSDSYNTPDLRSFLEKLSQKQVLTARLQELNSRQLSDALPDLNPDQLTVAIEDLRRFRHHPKPGHPWLLLYGGSLLALTLAAAWLRHHPAWIALPALPLLLAAAHWLTRRQAAQALRTRIPPPLSLPANLSPTEIDHTLAQWRTHRDQFHLQAERQQCESRITELETALAAARQPLHGLTPAPDDMWTAHFLADLQTLRDLRLELAANLEETRHCQQRIADTCNALRQTGAPGLQDITPDNADTRCEVLDQQLEHEIQRRTQQRQLHADLEQFEARHQMLNEEIQAICTRLHLDTPDIATLESRLQQLPAWREDFRASETMNHALSELRKRLESHPELLEADPPALQDLLHAAEQAGKDAEVLRDNITRLEHDIETAKRKHDLHDALEQVDALRNQLADERAKTLHVRAGAALVDWLRRETLTRQRPEVLETARKYLVHFTNGQLQLHFTGEQFLAGAPDRPPRPLDQLSTGERAQLLMALRLAFLDRIDRVTLPLFVDEALGTSDDLRAHAIMQALIRIAETGRQIFYFTAQSDEMAKWRAALQDSNVPHREIDLAAVRGQAIAEAAPLPPPAPKPAPTPLPAPSETPHAWAVRAGIPAIDRYAPVADAHLWHVVQDPAITAKLMDAGITTWGALAALLDAGGHPEWLSDAQAQTCRQRAEGLETYNRLWRINRPRPLTEADLHRAPAISDTFQERVAECLREVQGDAKALLDRLDAGAVNRWQRSKTGELAAWLEAEGLLSREPPFPEETLRARVLARTGRLP